MCSFALTTVFVYGAFSAGELHLYPDQGIPKVLRLEMVHLLMFQAGDALNTLLYLFQNNSFSSRNLMRWLVFTKLFAAAHLVAAYDDRLPELATAFTITTVVSYITA